MIGFVPNIFVYKYLQATGQLNATENAGIVADSIRYMKRGKCLQPAEFKKIIQSSLLI